VTGATVLDGVASTATLVIEVDGGHYAEQARAAS
jgi:very-short-patch-repair endonuclease